MLYVECSSQECILAWRMPHMPATFHNLRGRTADCQLDSFYMRLPVGVRRGS